MRRYAFLTTVAVLLLIPSTAFASPPQVVEKDTFVVDRNVTTLCPFTFHLHEEGSYTITEFYDTDGSLQKVLTKVQGTTLITTADGGDAWERWSWTEIYDPETDTTTVTGSSFNIHSGAGGVVVHDKGRVVYDSDFQALIINGPHQFEVGDTDGLCAALASDS